MIAIILRQPNGDGTWSDRIGLTTGDSSVTVAGFPCLPGWIGDGDVSEWSHRLNVSQARGGVPEAITWGFGLIDWDGSVRRSVGILDGQAQMVGWAVAMYVSTDGVTWSDAILGSVHFRVKSAPVNGRRIAIECVEAWGMDSHVVGESAGGLQVGAVAGGMPVTVEVPEIADPVALEYLRPAGLVESTTSTWMAGSPASPSPIALPATNAFDWNSNQLILTDRHLRFPCFDDAEAERLLGKMQSELSAGTLVISGEKFGAAPLSLARNGSSVYAEMPKAFKAGEPDATKLSAFSSSANLFPVAYGASGISGFAIGADTLAISGDVSVSGFVSWISPLSKTAASINSYKLIDSTVAYRSDSDKTTNQLAGFSEYSGSTNQIITSLASVGDFADLDQNNLWRPLNQTGGMLLWYNDSGNGRIRLRFSVENYDSLSFDRFVVDQKSRVALHYHEGSGAPSYVPPFSSLAPVYVSDGAILTTDIVGPYSVDYYSSFDSLEDMYNCEGMIFNKAAGDAKTIFNFEILAARLYGVKKIDISGASAVVQPGASRWWSSPEIPSKAADLLLSDLEDSGWVASSPSYEPSASRWGLAFDADRRVIDAAADIASEFWAVLGEGSNDVQSGAEGEIPGPPSFTLGDPVDIVTEPVIEYDYWAGSYRKRAYIAHVDEPYNSEDSQRYFAGWDEDGASTSYGLQIWTACRAAYLHHGRRKSVVYQSPGVRDAGILGWMWCATRNGRSRAEWLSLQTRYMTFSVRETVPSWWAGNVVRIPQTMATWAGYDLSALTSESLVVTEKRWNPLDMVTTFEVALPPVVPAASGDVIVQQLGAGYDLIQQTLNAGDTLLSQVVQ